MIRSVKFEAIFYLKIDVEIASVYLVDIAKILNSHNPF